MRQITRDAVKAFYASEPFKRGNTRVTVKPLHTGASLVRFYLHNNCIAERIDASDTVDITLAHWPTVTTRERVSGILRCYGYAVGQRDGIQVLLKRGEYRQDIDPTKWYIIGPDKARVA